jgi:polysaccharide export outer membrane protein
MPGRSNGWLLTGAGAVLALCVTGPGCQTQQISPATISSPTVAAANPAPIMATAASGPTVIAATPAPPQRFSFFRRARPAVEMDAPVAYGTDRHDQATQGMAVIASSWRGIDRDAPAQGSVVAAAAPGAAAATNTAPPDTSLQQTGVAMSDSQATEAPWHAVTVAAAEPMPAGSATLEQPTGTPPEPTAAPRLVPQPTPPVQPAPAPVVARAHYHYPSTVHDTVAVLPPVPAVPREFEKQSLPPYIVEPPDILLINASNAITLPTQGLQGQHLVRPDGTLNLGIYGSVYVAGLTLDQIQDVVASVLKDRLGKRKPVDGKPAEKDKTIDEIKLELQVDVLAYNSKVYYIVTDGGGYGEQVYRISATGNETVLDALSQINGLPAVASKKRIWVARATPDHSQPLILPVDWCGIVRNGSAATNYQIFPGDRVYVNSDARIRTDSALGKLLAPVERVLGTVLLGSSTVNSIRNGGTSNGSGVP